MNTILGLGVSNWILYIVMILFIVIYFVVTEIMNRALPTPSHAAP